MKTSVFRSYFNFSIVILVTSLGLAGIFFFMFIEERNEKRKIEISILEKERDLRIAKSSIEEITSKNLQINNQLSDTIKEMANQRQVFEEQVADSIQKISLKNVEIKNYKDSIETLKQDLQLERKKGLDEVENLRKKHEEDVVLIANSNVALIKKLEEKIQANMNEIKILNDRIVQLGNDNNSLLGNLRVAQTEVYDTKKLLDTANSTSKNLLESNSALKNQMDSLNKVRAQENSERKKELENQKMQIVQALSDLDRRSREFYQKGYGVMYQELKVRMKDREDYYKTELNKIDSSIRDLMVSP